MGGNTEMEAGRGNGRAPAGWVAVARGGEVRAALGADVRVVLQHVAENLAKLSGQQRHVREALREHERQSLAPPDGRARQVHKPE